MRVNPRHEKAAMRVHAVQNTMGSDTRKMNPSVDSRSSDAGSAPCGGTEPYVREPERNFPDPSGAAPGTPPDSMSPAASPREERIADRDASLHREALALRSGRSPRAGDASRSGVARPTARRGCPNLARGLGVTVPPDYTT